MKKSLRKRLLTCVLSASLAISLCGVPVCAAPEEAVGEPAGREITGICEHHTEHTAECGYAEEKPCGHVHTEECYVEVTECVHVHTQDCYPEAESSSEEDTSDENVSDNEQENPDTNEGDGEENSENGDNVFSGGRSIEPENCTHVCDVESGCITKELVCGHEHDDTCGYEEASPCTYQCSICNGQMNGTEDTEAGDGKAEPEIPDIKVPDEEAEGTEAEDETLCPHHTEHTEECGYIEGEDCVCTYECAVCALQELIDALPDTEEINEDNAGETAGQLTAIDDLKATMTEEELAQVDFARYLAAAAALEGFQGEPELVAERSSVRTEKLNMSSMTSSQENAEEGWKWDYDTKTLTLTNCHVKTQSCGGMIVFPSGCTATIVLEGENILESETMNYTSMIAGSGCDWVFKGDGSLQLLANGQPSNGNYAYGLSGSSVTIESGTITSNVCFCILDDFTMESGTLTISGPMDSDEYGIYADYSANIKGGKIDIAIGGAGIFVPGIGAGEHVVNISGGDITIKAGAGGIHVGGYDTSGRQEINITGGTLKCQVSTHAALFADHINISGQARVEAESEKQPAIRLRKNLTVSGEAEVLAYSPGLYGLYVPAGTLKVADSASLTAVGAVDGTAASVDKEEGAVLNAMLRTDTTDERIWTVYGQVELGGNMTLGPDALTTDTGTKAVKMVLTQGAVLTIPEGKILDVSQGLEMADVDTYLSGDRDTIIIKGEGEGKGQLLLPREKFTVTVDAEPENSGTVTGAGTYNEGDSITVNAQAAEGYQFVKWTEDSKEVSTESSYTFMIDADRVLTAVFEEAKEEPPAEETYTIGVKAEPSEGGTVKGGGIYKKAASVTVTAQPESGYKFVKWTENGVQISGAGAAYTFSAVADRQLTAVFEEIKEELPAEESYTIGVKAEPSEGGTVKGGGIYKKAAPVTVTAQPESGYKFVKWTENGTEISGAGAAYTFSVASDRQLTAVFEKDTEAPGTGDDKPEDPGTGDDKPEGPGTGDDKPEAPGTGDDKPEAPGTGGDKPEAPGTGDDKPEGPGTGGDKPEGPGTGDKPENPGTEEKPGDTDTDKKPASPDKGGNTNNSSGNSENTASTEASNAGNAQGAKQETSEAIKINSETDSAVIGNDTLAAAITRAQREAAQSGKSQDGIAVVIPIQAAQGQKNADITINAQTLDALMNKNVGGLEISISSMVSAEFDSGILKWLDDKSGGENIILRIRKPESQELAGESRTVIGSHPVYEISLVCVKGETETVIGDLEGRSIRLSLPYEMTGKENTGGLYAVYTDEKGKVSWLTDSVYDVNRKAVLVRANRQGTYGIAYRDLTSSFRDIENHWAKNDIAYVVNRGLMQGTGSGQFSPDGAVTWESLLAALGKTAGVLPANSVGEADFYKTWASEKGILSGNSYTPGTAVTREELAVILAGYMKNVGGSLSRVYEKVAFTDLNAVSETAKTAIWSVQQAGLMNGKDGNCFDPEAAATRAEAAAAIRKLIELRIDASAFQKWTRNESGHWLYYQSGSRLTGWQVIEGTPCFFNADGVMHEGEKQEPKTGNWYVYYGAGEVPVAMKKE